MTWRQLHPFVSAALISAVPCLILGTWGNPLNLFLNYHRYQASKYAPEPIPKEELILAVALSRQDQAKLEATSRDQWSAWGCEDLTPWVAVSLDYLSDANRPAWRRVHACLVRRLSRAHAKAIAFDQFFSEQSAPDTNTAGFAAAIKAAGIPVILGQRTEIEEHNALYSPPTRSALVSGDLDWWSDTVRELPLFGVSGDRALPGLALALFNSANGDKTFDSPSHELSYYNLAGHEQLWLRFSEQPPQVVDYSAVLRDPTQAEGRPVLVGIDGEWAASDRRRLPIVSSRPRIGTRDPYEEYGFMAHAYAYDMLVANQHGTKGLVPPEVTGGWRWLLLVLAALAGALPPMVFASWFVGQSELFALLDVRLTAIQRLRNWPYAILVGPAFVAVLVGVSWSQPFIYPVASVLLAATGAALAFGWPFWRTFRAARRFRLAMRRVEDARGERFPQNTLVRSPRDGLDILQALLAGPVLDQAAAIELVRWVVASLVEADESRTLFQNIPRSFFKQHGWLEAGADDATRLEKPVERADQLAESFIGTRLRRIRNDKSHVALKAHLVGMSRSALAAYGAERVRTTAGGCLRFQLGILADASEYLERLAEWLEAGRSGAV